MHDPKIHEQRDRAESFGRVAAEYDRYRQSYPVQLVDDLMARAPRTVLDVGCGTGKAARMLAERGAVVLGVEIDAQMAAVARSHGLAVEVASFEAWDDRGRRYDLITAGQAWHWVNPSAGLPKAKALLEPGGELAVFWNFDEPDEPYRTVIRSVYERLAPELVAAPGAGTEGLHLRRIRDSGCFGSVESITYPGRRSVPVEHWIGALGTQSNHLLLGSRLPQLLAAMRGALLASGPEVHLTGGTYLIRARP
jgi:SAM-dependent methyltransferase